MNPVLARQLRRLGLDPGAPPADEQAWVEFLQTVGRSYDEANRDRHPTKHSLQDSSVEMRRLYEKLRTNSEAQAKRSRHHYSNLFEESPIPTWEEDYREVAAWLESLREGDVGDLGSHFDEHPDAVAHGIGLIEVTDVNAAALAFLETDDKQAVLGHFDIDQFNDASLRSYREQFVAMWDGRPSISYEITGQRASGARLDAILHWSAPQIDGELDFTKVIVAMVDISERTQAMERMEELVRSKDDFLATVSHELRTPLTTVYGSAEALLDQWDELDTNLRLELIEFIARESGEIADLVEDLLVAARADIGRVKFTPRQIAIRPLVTSTVASARVPTSGRSIDICHVEGEVYADPLRLKQIVRNLLSNAIRYGGPEVRVAAITRDDRVILTVHDSGQGVPLDRRDSMFELYQRAHDHAGPVGSVGVGLAVSRQLAERMGGTLDYDYVDGWSRFALDLPARPPRLTAVDPIAAAAS